MGNSFKKIESGGNVVWITQPKESEKFLKRREVALKIAKEKLEENGGRIEPAIHIAEAFGRSLFEEYIKKEAIEWKTMDQWVKPVVKNVFNPMGTAATFTNITEDEAKSFVFRYKENDYDASDPYLSSLFTYGFLKGMLRSAFPEGDLILHSSMANGSQADEFTFKKKVITEITNETEQNKKQLLNNED